MRIIVTGASGQLGRLAAEQLLDRLSPEQLILVTRRPHALADLAERGVEVRRGDFDEPASLAEAFAGGDRMLLISTLAIGSRIEQHRLALEAAAAAGVTRVVYTSITNPVPNHPSGDVVEDHRKTEELLHGSGLAWTVLRNAPYAELQVPLGAIAVTYGKLVTNAGDGRIAPISRSDCAAVAAAVLTSDGHEGQTYEITGPEALSQLDIARLLSQVSGRPVDVIESRDRKLLWGLTRLGTPKPVGRAIVQLGVATREGFFDIVDPAFQTIVGRPARTLREILVEHRGELAGDTGQSVAYG
jgi:NAD(P)H dehydrogenase (quinone)